MTNGIQGNTYKIVSWFFNKLTKPEGNGMIYLKWWKGEPTTKNTWSNKTLVKSWGRNQKLSKQIRVKRIQQHQTALQQILRNFFWQETREGKDLHKINPKPKINKIVILIE